MKLAGGYIFLLGVLAVWGGYEAVAQGLEMPASTVLPSTPMGPVTFDLGNLTLPGALVVIAYLFREGIPFRLSLHHHNHEHKQDD